MHAAVLLLGGGLFGGCAADVERGEAAQAHRLAVGASTFGAIDQDLRDDLQNGAIHLPQNGTYELAGVEHTVGGPVCLIPPCLVKDPDPAVLQQMPADVFEAIRDYSYDPSDGSLTDPQSGNVYLVSYGNGGTHCRIIPCLGLELQ